MDIVITPTKTGGTVSAIPSKSEAHRLLICAMLAGSMSTIELAGMSDDVTATIGCLRALGCEVTLLGMDKVMVTPASIETEEITLNCYESGSTLRFIIPAAAALGANARFLGEGRLPERPLQPLLARMTEHGVEFNGETLPLRMRGRLNGGSYSLPGNVTSQFFTGLMLALPRAGGGEISAETHIESKSYIDVTIDAMRRYGVNVTEKDGAYTVPAGTYSASGTVKTGGDWSNAAFWLCLGALGGSVTVTGLDLSSAQGDRSVVDILRRFGANISQNGDSVTASRGELKATEIDASDIPDLIPVLSVVAAVAEGDTRIYNAGRLRLKESDRLAAIARNLTALGGSVTESEDSLVIHGGRPLSGGVADGFGDHRMIMSAAVAAQICSCDVTITGFEAVKKSYPDFFRDLKTLGGVFSVK